jgi:hypothetical protein
MAERRLEAFEYDPRQYHPHRKDGLDRNLRRINEADFLAGTRCTCAECVDQYEESRKHLEFIMQCRGGRK